MADVENLPTITTTSFNVPLENVRKTLSRPATNDRRENDQLFSSAGVKSHGTITFTNNKSNQAQFIRIPPDASVKHVKEILIRQWFNERPSLVISITGGAKHYNVKSKLLGVFRHGLLKVAQTTGAWIITGGMNSGVMKLVGDIAQINLNRSHPIHLIGIATWGCVAGVEHLDLHGTNIHYTASRKERKGEAPLEPNHTKFIFVDDGSKHEYGKEIEFRASLEQAISGDFFGPRTSGTDDKLCSSLLSTQGSQRDSEPIPVVLIVIEGGLNTVQTVYAAVVQNNIPAVFIDGSGRCCNLFAKAYRLYEKYRSQLIQSKESSQSKEDDTSARYEEIKNKLREDLKDELFKLINPGDDQKGGNGKKQTENVADFSEKSEHKANSTDCFEQVYECVHTRFDFLNVIPFNEDSPRLSTPTESDIDLTILDALLKATSIRNLNKTNDERKREQFRLALEWNRVDIAKRYIIKDDDDWKNIDLNDMFELALRENKIDFVKLFLDNDFSLTNVFQNNQKLLELYANNTKRSFQVLNCSDDPLRVIYKYIIRPRIGDSFQFEAALNPQKFLARKTDDDDDDDDFNLCSCRTTSWIRQHRRDSTTVELDENLSFGGSSFDSPKDIDKELFLWSVICDQTGLDLLFWARGKNKICTALIATLIYRKRARKESDQGQSNRADLFEGLAIRIIDKFYHTNPHACGKAIIRKIPAYGNVTWLDLAAKARAKKFIATTAVQEVLSDIWYGCIDQHVTPMMIIFSTIMLWYSGALHYNDELVQTRDQPTYSDESSDKLTVREKRHRSKKIRILERTPTSVHRSRSMSDLIVDDETSDEFSDVGYFEKRKISIKRYLINVLKFIRAPYVKFIYNSYLHIIFLILMSYVVLCDFLPLYDFPPNSCAIADDAQKSQETNDNVSVRNNGSDGNNTVPNTYQYHNHPSGIEWLLAVWVFTLLCEEFRQFVTLPLPTIVKKMKAYFKVFWNQLDILAIILFYIAFFLRFIPRAQCYCAARIILAIDIIFWYIRMLELFAAIKLLGPKLVMIGKMFNDLKYYILMLLIFILAFGVSTYSLRYGVQKLSWHLPRKIVNVAYWEIFGELDSLEGVMSDFSANGYIVFVVLIGYMLVVGVLLINLLIAMFSYTYENLQNDTDRIWKFQRYALICNYLSRPSLPPPFIFLSHLSRLSLYLLKKYTKSRYFKVQYEKYQNRTNLQIVCDDEKLVLNIESAEDVLGEEVYYNHIQRDRSEILNLFNEIITNFDSSKQGFTISQQLRDDIHLQLNNNTNEQRTRHRHFPRKS